MVSEFIREDLNATGTFDATAATDTVLELIRSDGYVIGDRRSVKIETDRNVQTDTNILVASQRLDFQPRYDVTTEAINQLGVAVS